MDIIENMIWKCKYRYMKKYRPTKENAEVTKAVDDVKALLKKWDEEEKTEKEK